MDNTSVKEGIRAFLEENFFIDFEETESGENLLEAGYIDSFGFVRLVEFLEQTYGISIPTDDLMNDSLTSLSQMVDYVTTKQKAS